MVFEKRYEKNPNIVLTNLYFFLKFKCHFIFTMKLFDNSLLNKNNARYEICDPFLLKCAFIMIISFGK